MEIIKAVFNENSDSQISKSLVVIEQGEVYIVTGDDKNNTSKFLRFLGKADDFDWGSFEGDTNKYYHNIDKKDISYMPGEIEYSKHLKINDLLNKYQLATPNFDIEYALSHLKTFNLNPSLSIKKLSIDKKKLISFIIALSFNCSLYVIDDSLLYQNLNIQKYLNMIIKKYQANRTFIISTSQVNVFEEIASKLIIIKDNSNIEITNILDIDGAKTIDDYCLESIKCL